MSETKKFSTATEVSTVNSNQDVLLTDDNGAVTKISFANLRAALLEQIKTSIPATMGQVWIVTKDSDSNTILTDWQSYSGASADALGVAIMSGGRRLIIAKDEISGYWSTATGVGYQATTSKDTADQRFDGKAAFASICANAAYADDINNTAVALGYCKNYAKVNSSGKGFAAGSWWLPSLGELGMIYEQYNAINAALAKIGGTSLARTYYWSCTEYSATNAWHLPVYGGNRWSGSKTTYSPRVRPVTAF